MAVYSSLTSQHSRWPPGGEAAGDADRGVPGEGADLHGAAGADEAGEQGEQRALVGADLHAGDAAELGRASLELDQHVVGRGRPLGDVGGDGCGHEALAVAGDGHGADGTVTVWMV